MAYGTDQKEEAAGTASGGGPVDARSGQSMDAQVTATNGSAASVGAGAPQLEVRNIVKDFDQNRAVAGVSLAVAKGEMFGLLGPSGCGKSTTLRCIAGLEMIDGGQVLLTGDVVADAAKGKFVPPEKRNMAMVFQAYAVWPHMTVAENVGFPLKLRRLKKAEIRERVMEMLQITGLEQAADRPATMLSGGQQQRVALARALVYLPDILLLDEPLSNLDANLREEMRHEIVRLQQKLGVTIVFVTHDRFEAMALADRVAIMNNGRVEQLGTPNEVYERPKTPFVRDFLGNAIIVSGLLRQSPAGSWVELDEKFGGGSVTFDQPLSEGLGDGKRVLVGCRPEDVDLRSEDAAPSTNGIRATIADSLYQGTHVEYTLAMGDESVRVWGPRSGRREVGTDVIITLDPAHCWVWAES